MDTVQRHSKSTRGNVGPPRGGGFEVMVYSARGVDTVRLKTLPSVYTLLVQKDDCGSRRAETIIESSLHNQVPSGKSTPSVGGVLGSQDGNS